MNEELKKNKKIIYDIFAKSDPVDDLLYLKNIISALSIDPQRMAGYITKQEANMIFSSLIQPNYNKVFNNNRRI